MAPLLLKVKTLSNSFQPFSNLNSADELEKTWKICTKAKDALENGVRLENLSWRLWHRHQTLTRNNRLHQFKSLSELQLKQLGNNQSFKKLPVDKQEEDPIMTFLSEFTLPNSFNFNQGMAFTDYSLQSGAGFMVLKILM